MAGIVISVARSASTLPVALPVDATRSVSMDRTWFVINAESVLRRRCRRLLTRQD